MSWFDSTYTGECIFKVFIELCTQNMCILFYVNYNNKKCKNIYPFFLNYEYNAHSYKIDERKSEVNKCDW